MKRPEEVRREFVRQWIRKADEDLAAARLLIAQRPDLRYVSCFHAQQAAEKYLKAFLVEHQIEFQKTHDLALLLDRAAVADPALALDLGDAEELSIYGVEVRYPSDLPDPSTEQVRAAFETAERVRATVLARIIPESRGDP